MAALLRFLLPLSFLVTITISTNVIIPLYIFPSDTLWEPIYSAATNYTNLKVQVVINPSSGQPGSTPDPSYAAGVAKLKSHLNVEVLGYIATGIDPDTGADRRNTAPTFMANYASWPIESRPTGIFFDEVVRTSSADVIAMRSLTSDARSRGFNGTVVFNAGAIPVDQALFNEADQVVAFEGCYDGCGNGADYKGKRAEDVAALTQPASKISVIIHTMPLDNALLQSLVDTFKTRKYGSIYLTDDPATYSHFGADWNDFVKFTAA